MNNIRYKDPQKINKFLKGGIEINNLFQFCLKIQNTKKVYSTLKV